MFTNQSPSSIARDRLKALRHSDKESLAVAKLARVVTELNKGQGMTASQIVGLVGLALKVSNGSR